MEKTFCSCGKTWAHYNGTEDPSITISGPAYVFAILNPEYKRIVATGPGSGVCHMILISDNDPSIYRVEENCQE